MDSAAWFTLDVFKLARRRISPYVIQSPNIYDTYLNVYLKQEFKQPTHAFKVRGAFNKILQVDPCVLSKGVITASAGNHGQAVAMACQKHNVPVQVFVPENTPRIKLEHIASFGASIVQVEGFFGDAERAAIIHAKESDKIFISAYNDREVITGAGTIALEWLEQTPNFERILVPVGGGGLICGVGLAAKVINPNIEIIGILSEASPYLYEQFYTGHMDRVKEKPTLTDGLAGAVEPGSITIDLIHHACDVIIKVPEEAVAKAIAWMYHQHQEVIEGSSAVGIAAIFEGLVTPGEKITGVLLSGGNIDLNIHQDLCKKYPITR